MSELQEHLRAETEAHLVMDVADHASQRVFEMIRMHAMTMPSVSAAIGVGLLAARQIYAETIQFAVNSMEGDKEDEEAIREAASNLFRELLSQVDIPEVLDWSNAKRGRFYQDPSALPHPEDK